MDNLQAKVRRAAAKAGHHLDAGLDLRDRSEPAELRPSHVVQLQPAPAPKVSAPIAGPVLAERHLEPVEPFSCPRCSAQVEGAAFYGPCQKCALQLRAGDTVSAVLPPDHEAAPHGAASSVVLSRQQRRYRNRPTICAAVPASVAELLHELPAKVERVLLVGERPGLTAAGDRAWYLGELPAGWSHHEAGHYLHGGAPVGKYRNPAGQPVEVHRAASWFGDGTYTVDEAETARAELEQLLDGLGVGMLATPATTGRQLLLRTIPERDGGWPVLADEHQELIRSTSGQGRVELFPPSEHELGELHEYDGRWFYAGLCWGLGAGPAVHDDLPTFDPYARGRYLVRFTVPADWRGVGLLGVKADEGGWSWPAEPGSSWESWADGAELLVAQKAGWTFRVLERLLLTDHKGNPLGGWADRIVKAAEGRQGLVRAGLRRTLLATIGTLHGRSHSVTKVYGLSQADEVPAGAPVRRYGQQLAAQVDTGQAWPAMAHPEWSAAIWARARARLLSGPGRTGALHLAEGSRVVAMRTDALYVTSRQPAWEQADDGRPGRLSYRGGRDEAAPLPANVAELLSQRTWKD